MLEQAGCLTCNVSSTRLGLHYHFPLTLSSTAAAQMGLLGTAQLISLAQLWAALDHSKLPVNGVGIITSGSQPCLQSCYLPSPCPEIARCNLPLPLDSCQHREASTYPCIGLKSLKVVLECPMSLSWHLWDGAREFLGLHPELCYISALPFHQRVQKGIHGCLPFLNPTPQFILATPLRSTLG